MYMILHRLFGVQAGHEAIDLAAALAGNDDKNPLLHDGDVLITVPKQAGWKDVGAVVTLSGEVRNPGYTPSSRGNI